MHILVLGAGGVGGYFGGALARAGGVEELAFLVRPRRKAQLDRDGLVIETAAKDTLRQPARTILAGEAAPGWDIVLLSCKAYDLDDAIAAIRPAVDGRTAVLPFLNGMSHLDTLEAAFGKGRVLGGLCGIQVVMTGSGVVRQLGPGAFVKFGELDGPPSPRVAALKSAFDAAGVDAEAPADIRGAMWAKLVFLGSLAAAGVLLRANLGEIAAAPGGAEWLARLLDRNATIAAAHGHPVAPKELAGFHAFFRGTPGATASILRDLESGARIEGDHILGFLLEAARRAGIPDELHEAAFLGARAYDNRREAGRLPRD